MLHMLRRTSPTMTHVAHCMWPPQDAVDFIAQRLDQGMTPTQSACALLDACLANDPKEARGVGCDNMTIVVVELKHDGEAAAGTSAGAAPAAATAAQ